MGALANEITTPAIGGGALTPAAIDLAVHSSVALSGTLLDCLFPTNTKLMR